MRNVPAEFRDLALTLGGFTLLLLVVVLMDRHRLVAVLLALFGWAVILSRVLVGARKSHRLLDEAERKLRGADPDNQQSEIRNQK